MRSFKEHGSIMRTATEFQVPRKYVEEKLFGRRRQGRIADLPQNRSIRKQVLETLEETGGDVLRAAELLNFSPNQVAMIKNRAKRD
tara:strand:+ start:301 stop:558 length:258 start_codon:yes stop_codon:yes gene_type:complete